MPQDKDQFPPVALSSAALQTAPQAVKRSMPAALSVLLGLLGAVFIIWCIGRLVWFIFLLYLSVLFATVLDEPVSWFKSKGVGRGLSSTILLLGALGLMVVAVLLASNVAYEQFVAVSSSLQQLPQRIDAWVNDYRVSHPAFKNTFAGLDAHKFLADFGSEHIATAGKGLLAGAGWGLETLASLAVLFFLTLYLTIDGEDYFKGLRRLLPQHVRFAATHLFQDIAKAHRRWFVASISNFCSASILSSLGLWLLEIPGAILLGVIAGLGELVPNIGPGIMAIPALLVTLVILPGNILLVLLMFIIVQTLQGYVISPHVMKQGVKLPPLVTIIAVLVMGTLFGILGAIVAIPLTADLVVLWKFTMNLVEKMSPNCDEINESPGPIRTTILPASDSGS